MPEGANVKTEVKGNVFLPLGDNSLSIASIENVLNNLLERRGYTVTTQFNYSIKLSFSVINGGKSFFKNDRFSSYDYSYVTPNSLGVFVAQQISESSPQNILIHTERNAPQYDIYKYVLSVAIYDKKEELIWKGESVWDSSSLNFDVQILPSLQVILSNLPRKSDAVPRFPKVKEDSWNTFLRVKCIDASFVCPALPYFIQFPDPATNSYIINNKVKNPEAFEAYLDLIQTAEYALPLGNTDFSDPLDRDNWSKVMLSGEYYLGNDQEKTKILIRLRGTLGGYVVEKCMIADEEEYNENSVKMAEWKTALHDYFDFYEND